MWFDTAFDLEEQIAQSTIQNWLRNQARQKEH
jgi:hypothetical protein